MKDISKYKVVCKACGVWMGGLDRPSLDGCELCTSPMEMVGNGGQVFFVCHNCEVVFSQIAIHKFWQGFRTLGRAVACHIKGQLENKDQSFDKDKILEQMCNEKVVCEIGEKWLRHMYEQNLYYWPVDRTKPKPLVIWYPY